MERFLLMLCVISVFFIHGCSESGDLSLGKTVVDKDGNPIINEMTAIKLINEHIGDHYSGMTSLGSWDVLHKTEDARQGTLRLLGALKNEGLITFEAESSDPPPGRSWYTTQLTEKGKRESIQKARNDKKVGFHTLNLKVEKVVSISDDNTVLFVYTNEPTELGRKYGKEEGLPKRGTAKFKYDPFLEKFIFKGFWWSEMSEEDWQKGRWIYESEGDKLIVDGPAPR